MGLLMTTDPSDLDDLLRRARSGDQPALAELFTRYRDRLRQMVCLRLDRRLQGRLDPSDVLQEAYLDLARRLPEYAANPALPFFLWLRGLTGQRLIDLHRQHLGAKMRDAAQEVSLYRGALLSQSGLVLRIERRQSSEGLRGVGLPTPCPRTW
jgi:RNA polymerase sigma-70 factor (ECF subfamily)